MATQGQRQNYNWRPNTYDSITLTRYSQEAKHWTTAFKSANRPTPSFSSTMGTIGLVIELAFIILWFLLSGTVSFLSWLFRCEKRHQNKLERLRKEKERLIDEEEERYEKEVNRMMDEAEEIII